MRIGTFRCWLWGHKFVGRHTEWGKHPQLNKPEELITYFATPYCVRCGISLEAKEQK